MTVTITEFKTEKLPPNLHLHTKKTVDISLLSREELDIELQKGIEALKFGKAYTADEVETELAREFGI